MFMLRKVTVENGVVEGLPVPEYLDAREIRQ